MAGFSEPYTEKGVMFARLLKLGDRSLLSYELARMGHHNPEEVLSCLDQPCAAKLIDVPKEIATLLIQWLEHQEPPCWWHSSSDPSAPTVDLLFGGSNQIVSRLRQAAQQIPHLRPVAAALDQAWCFKESAPLNLLLGETSVALQHRTYVMGILNVTPDSFSDGGLYLQPEQAIKHAEEMLADGADIIDVGGQSSRPGARAIPLDVERQRVMPVVREIVKRYGARVSVDTYRASIAEAALDVGAVLINDISAMRFDAKMAPLIARYNASVVLMHMRGTPQTMQQEPTYRHVIDAVYSFLAERLRCAMHHGIARQRIILDPGFGFGKTARHNLELLHGLEHFQGLGQPLLVGTSRKSFLGRLLQREVWDRLEGTIASVIYAALRGAAMVRVHDVKSAVQAIRLINTLETLPNPPAGGEYLASR
jgi:dihydropteroate synthase